MIQTQYDETRDELLGYADDIQTAKRPGYTVGNADVLKNFQSVGERCGISTRKAWLVYFLKHVDALCLWAKDPSAPQAEDIMGRFADVINYCQLGYAIHVEEEQALQSAPAEFRTPFDEDVSLKRALRVIDPPKTGKYRC